MTITQESAPPWPAADVPPTYAQLHEQACIECGAADDLTPAGHRKVAGLNWAVAACAEHVVKAAR